MVQGEERWGRAQRAFGATVVYSLKRCESVEECACKRRYREKAFPLSCIASRHDANHVQVRCEGP